MNSGIPEKIKQAIHEQSELLSARCKDWAELRIYPTSEWIEEALLTALAPHFTQQPASTPDWERIEIIRRADWISSPCSSPSSNKEWRVHVSLEGSGQTTACGKTLIEAIDRANEWFKRSMLSAARLNTEIKTK